MVNLEPKTAKMPKRARMAKLGPKMAKFWPLDGLGLA